MDNGHMPDVIPKLSVALQTDEQSGNDFIWLVITTPLTVEYVFIANPSNYRQVAQGLHDAIIKAGRDAKPPRTLEVVKGLPDGIRAAPKGRKLPR